ncbi:unnamed protein product [Cylicocyclus nassatus]|uniref:Uncharacterized protein n=1 Tax=Cylicocyclus nassatus TaxID=53992 RepID=A0AA36MCY1_CYLNA|nr:unnamed protein product [Cylicocyclus nassatus]
MNTLTLSFSIAVAFGVFSTVLFAMHLYNSIVWITDLKDDKLKDKCVGSGSFMTALSFFGTISFLAISLFSGCAGMALMFSKDYEKVKKILTIMIASTVVLAIIESVAMLIAIAAKLDIKCLKDNINKQFVVSWVLILVNVVISPLFMLSMFIKTSFVESESGSERKTPISNSSYNPYNNRFVNENRFKYNNAWE